LNPHSALTPVAATRFQAPNASSAVRPSGFSQITCLPASAATIDGSAWMSFGPETSKSCTRSSATTARQSVRASVNP
jgi:hypothetical protein